MAFSLRNVVRGLQDVFDPNTEADKRRRLEEGKSAQYIRGEVARTPVQRTNKPVVTIDNQVRQLQQQSRVSPEFKANNSAKIKALLTNQAAPISQAEEILRPSTSNRGALDAASRPLIGGLATINPVKTVGELTQLATNGRVGKSLADFGDTNGTVYGGNYDRGIDQQILRAVPGLAQDAAMTAASGGVSLGLKGAKIAKGAKALTSGASLVGLRHGSGEAYDVQQDALNRGIDPTRATITGLGSGVTTGLLAKYGASNLFSPTGNIGAKFVKRTIGEGLEEGSQQLASNIARRTFNPDQDLTQGVAESAKLGGIMGGLVSGVSLATDPTVQKVGNKVIQANTALISNKPPLSREEIRTLSDYQDYKLGNLQDVKTVNQIIPAIRQIAQEQGVDLTSGSPAQIMDKVNSLIEGSQMRRSSQGGFIGGIGATGYDQAQADGRVFEGVDGKPRFEVDDSGAKLIAKIDEYGLDVGRNAKLSSVLDHPKLYEQYPQLKDVKVEVTEDLDPGSASYDPSTNRIELSPETTSKETILHEIQHAIQEKESFVPGGSIADSVDKVRLLKEYPEVKQWKKRLSEIQQMYHDNAGTLPQDVTRTQRKELAQEQRTLERNIGKAEYSILEGDYRNLAGEAEARAVANRMNMTDGERYATPKPKASDKRLYRGLEKDFDPNYDMNNTDAPAGYSTWTDSPELARQYAGDNGKVYTLDLPKSKQGSDIVDQDGDRALFLDNEKPAGLNGVSGKEYLVYNDHELYNPSNVKESKPQSTFYDSLDVPKEDLIIRENNGGISSFVRLPGEDSEIRSDLSNDQATFINDYAEMIQGMDGNGVTINGDGTRSSSNSPFYREVYAEKGRAPTKEDWFNEARNQIESGKAAYGASEDYKQVPAQATDLNRNEPKINQVEPKRTEIAPKPTTKKAPPPISEEEWAGLLGDRKTVDVRTGKNDKLEIAETYTDRITNEIKKEKITETDESPIRTKIEGDFKESSNLYLGSILASETEAKKIVDSLPVLPKDKAIDAIMALDSGTKTGDTEIDQFSAAFKKTTDDLYARYRNAGVDMNFVESYVPRIYKNPLGGENLTRNEYLLLQMGTGRTKKREAPVIDTEALAFKTPEALIAQYVRTMEKVASGREYFDNLRQQGYVLDAPSRPQGMKLVEAEGIPQPPPREYDGVQIQGNYYAEPVVADAINKIFGSQIENGVIKKAARVSSVAQDIGLSGGLPFTPVNSFAMAQATKEIASGNIKGPAIALTKSFRKKDSEAYFKDNADTVSEMQKLGIPLRTEYNTDAIRKLSQDIGDQDGKLGKAWDKIMSDATFKRFLPIMQIETYKAAKLHSDAKTAAKVVENFYGQVTLADQRMRDKNISNAITVAAFAPKYRESMVRFWINNAKALRHPTQKEYRQNLKFVAGATVMFGAMQALNVALNGVPTWENPDGKKDKLLIPDLPGIDGKTVGIPYLTSIATVPRNIFMGAANAVTGNPDEVKKNVKSFVSYAGRPLLDVMENENYFGSRIIDKEDTTGEKLGSQASYLAQAYMHPYVREALNAGKQALPESVGKFVGARDTTAAESVSKALESPLRFYDPKYFKGGADSFKTEDSDAIEVTKNGQKVALSSLPLSERLGKYFGEKTDIAKYPDITDDINKAKKEVASTLTEAGYPVPDNIDTRMIDKWASYQKQKESGSIPKLEAKSKDREFARDIYKTQLNPESQALLAMSDEDIRTAINEGLVEHSVLDEALAADEFFRNNKMFATDNYSYLGSELREQLGLPSLTKKKSSGGSSGRSKRSTPSFDITKLFAYSNPATGGKTLRDILNKTLA